MQWIVLKCGGSVFDQLPSSFYENIVELGQSGKWQPVIVHGGGPMISGLLQAQQIPVQFVDGLRVTTNEVLDVAEMVLSGLMNKKIVRRLMQAGGSAFGLSGVDGQLITARQVEDRRLGFVGEVRQVNKHMLQNLAVEQMIPVISPIGIDDTGQRFNINADTAAGAVAQALGAHLCLISDIPGIMAEENGLQKVLKTVHRAQAEQLIEDGVITGGMIPKVRAALAALDSGVPQTVILNGMEDHLLQYCAGGTPGTKLVLDDVTKKEGMSHA